ncbi:MFS transporter [Neptuniibacter caesariensis]|uniref:Major facilitator superfamily protein n=1 Tax=Neptuniibacter caesariensis TaxID=207954 RepID=A0A7U8C8G6_NEPCE|nr:MFS transporter [Neptuniibacter caesariensis]EAR61746.1 Major facilitator superfamily protein [Neptuniibacter caesariensis]
MDSYIRLSGFYFFYFALLGALVPYWSLYLKSFNFDAQTIGSLMALLQMSRIVAPNLWGWLADRSGKRVQIVRFGALMTWIMFIGIFWQDTAVGIGLVMLGFSFFWNAVLPQFEVITLRQLGDAKNRYSRIRLWGSVGFIIAVVGIGALLDYLSITWLPWIMLAMMLLIWLNTLLIPRVAKSTGQIENVIRGKGFIELLLRPQVIAFFSICLLIQFGHGAYYTFYSVLMVDVGYSRAEVGLLWAIGVIAEVIVFIYMHWMLQRWGIRAIMIVSLMLCVLRWLLIGLVPENLPLMLLAQTLHAATFGALHAVGIALVNHYFTEQTHGQGQALFSSFGFGLGGALGAFVSGLLWDDFGVLVTFGLSAAASFVAILLALIWIYPEKVQQNN